MDIFFLAPIEATYISQLYPNNNFGPCEKLFVGQSAMPTDNYRALLKFDIRTIPQGSIIEKVTLRLFLNQENSSLTKDLFVNRLLSNFSQNTVTWNNAPEFRHTFFSTIVSDDNINNYIYINITELARGWYSKSIENNGILLSTLETAMSKMEFFGFEDEVLSHCPSLLIEYTKIKEQDENNDTTSNTVAADNTEMISDVIIANANDATGNSVSNSIPHVIPNISPMNKTDFKGTSSTINSNKAVVANNKTNPKGKNFGPQNAYGKKNSGKGANNKKNNGNVPYNKKNNSKSAIEITTISNPGSIIPFASGSPIFINTVNGGQSGNASLLGFGSAAIDVPLLDGYINLMGSKLEPVINFAFSVPRAGCITSIAAYFSNVVELNLVNSTVNVIAQVFKSTTTNNIFYPIQDTFLVLGPPLTGTVSIGTVCKGASSNLSIDVNIEDRLLLVIFATASGLSLINSIIGYASAGLTIA